jgi:hypothetical protein
MTALDYIVQYIVGFVIGVLLSFVFQPRRKKP